MKWGMGSTAVLLIFALTSVAEARSKIELDPMGVPLAAPDAAVDRVAYSYTKKAIVKLKRLIKKKQYKPQEPDLLMRLGRLYQENGEIAFRIAHAEAYFSKKPINLTHYKEVMGKSIQAFNRYIANYSDRKQVPLAYLLRAKAFDEVGNRKAAIQDFKTVVVKYPKFDEVNTAFLALADYAVDDGQHAAAIAYFKRLLRDRNNPEYAYATYKIAWSYYHMGKVDRALHYLKKYIAITKIKHTDKNSKTLLDSGRVLRDEVLVESTLFFLKGFEEGLPRYSIGRAIPFFRELAFGTGGGAIVGRMLVRFAKLLRAHNHQQALNVFKDDVIKMESKRSEALEVLLIAYDDQLQKLRYNWLKKTADDINQLQKKHGDEYSFASAEEALMKSADTIQKFIVSAKTAKRKKGLTVILHSIYSSFLGLIPEGDPRNFRVHYNLAEAFSGIEKYGYAINHYTWVVERARNNPALAKASGVDVTSAGLKAIEIRYEDLKRRKLIPKEIKLKKLEDDDPKDLNPRLAQWIGWIHSIDKLGIDRTKFKKSDFYFFEAARTYYYLGHIEKTMADLTQFALANPRSEFAIPAAELVIDTLIASKKYERLYNFTIALNEINTWKDKKFQGRTFTVAADAFYKLAEQRFNAGEYDKVMSQAPTFEQRFYKVKSLPDWLNLVGRSALALDDQKTATYYFTKLLKDAPTSPYVGDVILLNANRAEKRYDFASGARYFKTYLSWAIKRKKVDSKEANFLRNKILKLTWLSEEPRTLRDAIKDKEICPPSLATTCERYLALSYLMAPDEMRDKNVYAVARNNLKSTKSAVNRALWSVLYLDSNWVKGYKDRYEIMENYVRVWDKIDPPIRYTLLPDISRQVPLIFQDARLDVARKVKIQADPNIIQKRVALIKEVEKMGQRAIKLPWARIQALVLSEVASLYMDLSTDIESIPAPRGMTEEENKVYRQTLAEVAAPFSKTGKEIRVKAFKIASLNAIEEEAFRSIAVPYFQENPKTAKLILPNGLFPSGSSLQVDVLERMDSSFARKDSSSDSYSPSLNLKIKWRDALQRQSWAQVSYFLAEAKTKSMVKESLHKVMSGIALAKAGARAEGIAEIESVIKNLELGFDESERNTLMVTLLKQYLNTLAKDKVITLLEEIDEDLIKGKVLTDQESKLVSNWMET